MKVSTISQIVRTRTIELSGEDLINVLKKSSFFKNMTMTNVENGDQISVTFQVPRGGDYSGDVLEITEDNPIKISVTTRVVENENS